MGAWSARIEAVVSSWTGVETVSHRFGGREFRVGRRELGHLHGDSLLDVPFPVVVRDRLVAENRAVPHHVLPDTGWVSFRLRAEVDVDRAIELLRLNYDRPWLSSAPAVVDVVEEASRQSFPASDAPAYGPVLGPHLPRD